MAKQTSTKSPRRSRKPNPRPQYTESEQAKVFGGLIAKQVVRRLERIPEKVFPKHLDDAVQDVVSYKGQQPSGVMEKAKQEAARLLTRAREMGSLRAAMETYKRELIQLHDSEKLKRARMRAFVIRAGAAAAVVVVLIALLLLLT